MSMKGKKLAVQRVTDILNAEADCGRVRKIFELMYLGRDSYVVLFEADGPWYGAFIAYGHVVEAGGTGNKTCRELIGDRLINGGEFCW